MRRRETTRAAYAAVPYGEQPPNATAAYVRVNCKRTGSNADVQLRNGLLFMSCRRNWCLPSVCDGGGTQVECLSATNCPIGLMVCFACLFV